MCVPLHLAKAGEVSSSGVANLDVQTLPDRRQRRFELIQPGVVPERKQSFDVRLGYSNAAGQVRFPQTRRQECRLEIDLGGLQSRERDGVEPRPAATRWRRQWAALPDVVANGQHEEILRHIHGFLTGFTLCDAVTEIRQCHDVAASLPVGFE